MLQEMLPIERILVMILPLVFAVVIHEVAHGWVALQFGDNTAKMLGRLTLNPIKHIDLFGTILVPALMAYFTPFIFGWAKPVPVDWRNLKNPRRDMALVAFAGPATNLIMAAIWAIILGLSIQTGQSADGFSYLFVGMCYFGVIINVVLFVLNMLPIPPLDGSRVVTSALPTKMAYVYNRLEPYGFFILLALIFSGLLAKIMLPLIVPLMRFFESAFIM